MASIPTRLRTAASRRLRIHDATTTRTTTTTTTTTKKTTSKWPQQGRTLVWRTYHAMMTSLSVDEIEATSVATNEQSKPSLTDAVRPYFEANQQQQQQRPLVIRHAMSQAPAIELWKDWSYFSQTSDMEYPCHAEIGGNYATSERIDIRLGDYVSYLQFFEEKFGRSAADEGSSSLPSADDLIYLAQNDIVPAIMKDFALPDIVEHLGAGRLYSVMMWMGPYGCVSPLHFDPLDNIFMQFVGVKKVILFPPNTHVYAAEDGNQSNTSPINFEEPLDLKRYPLLKELPPALTCTLYPGDLLYIPKKWWHQVRTIESSVSINAWWR